MNSSSTTCTCTVMMRGKRERGRGERQREGERKTEGEVGGGEERSEGVENVQINLPIARKGSSESIIQGN